MKDRDILDLYVSFAPFLAHVLGSDTEVVIHDVTDPKHSIIAIENNASGRAIGHPLTDLAKDLVERSAYAEDDFLVNYKGSGKGAEFLSSTYYIKNGKKLIGLLCVNKNIEAVKEMSKLWRVLMERYNLCPPSEETVSETLDNSLETMMLDRIREIVDQTGIPPARMSLEEKVKAAHRLSEDGVLTMKGAVPAAAEMLGISAPTFYRYLKKES